MNRNRAFASNELTITIALSAVGLGVFLPIVQLMLKHGLSLHALIFLGGVTALPLALLGVARYAELRKNYDLQDLCGLAFIVTVLPGVGSGIGLLFFLGKVLTRFPW